jgi:hypothetical protein
MCPGRSFLALDLAGKMWESHRILQENTENVWNIAAVFPPGIFHFFLMISGRILPESTGSCRNPPKKIWKITGRNNASNCLVFWFFYNQC